MNRLFLTLIGFIPIIPVFADTYTLYVIEADEPVISERSELDVPTILDTPGIRVAHTLQTEGVPYAKKPAASTPSTDPFADSSERNNGSEHPDEDEGGTRFQVEEEGDKIAYSFSEVKEVRIPSQDSIESPTRAIFERFALESELTLKPDTFLLTGEVHRQESVDDQPPQHKYRWIILVRGSPARATIEIPQAPTIITRGGIR